jgi:hypothetical protein
MRLFTGGLPMRTILLLSVVATVLAVPAAAPAAGWNCSAGAVLGQPVGGPVTANVGAAACKAAGAGDLPALPIPLQASAVSARTPPRAFPVRLR